LETLFATPALLATNNSVVGMTMMDCYAREHQKNGGRRQKKGGTPEMEVAGIDICLSLCSLLNSLKN